MKAVSVKTLEILREFVNGGGTLIAFTELPKKSSEKDMDQKVVELICELFGRDTIDKATIKEHENGGKAFSLKYNEREKLVDILKDMDLNVKVENPVFGLQYIHKKDGGKNIWYFASLGDDINETVALKGEYDLTAFDPKTKEEIALKYQKGNGRVKIDLSIDKGGSLLIIEK